MGQEFWHKLSGSFALDLSRWQRVDLTAFSSGSLTGDKSTPKLISIIGQIDFLATSDLRTCFVVLFVLFWWTILTGVHPQVLEAVIVPCHMVLSLGGSLPVHGCLLL